MIAITGHLTAENMLVCNGEGTLDVLWIDNWGVEASKNLKRAKSYWVVNFDDIDCKYADFVMPNRYDIESSLGYAEDKKNIIVSCVNGSTRSSAIAYLINCKRVGPGEAIKLLVKHRHYPNKLIVQLGAELLKDKNIYEIYNQWVIRPLFLVKTKKTSVPH